MNFIVKRNEDTNYFEVTILGFSLAACYNKLGTIETFDLVLFETGFFLDLFRRLRLGFFKN